MYTIQIRLVRYGHIMPWECVYITYICSHCNCSEYVDVIRCVMHKYNIILFYHQDLGSCGGTSLHHRVGSPDGDTRVRGAVGKKTFRLGSQPVKGRHQLRLWTPSTQWWPRWRHHGTWLGNIQCNRGPSGSQMLGGDPGESIIRLLPVHHLRWRSPNYS